MDFSYCPTLAEMVRSRRTVGQSGRVFEGLAALSTVNNLSTLRALMTGRRPARTLEVGLSYGGSALAIAATHRDLGHPPGHQHVTIDPFQHSVWDGAGLAALDEAGLRGFVDFRELPSAVGLAALMGAGARFDLIYIDGSHLFEDVFVDAYFAAKLLSADGIVLFDDSTNVHVAKVLRFVRRNWREWIAEVDLSPFHADGASLRYQVGKRVGAIHLRAFRMTGQPPRPWDAPLHRF